MSEAERLKVVFNKLRTSGTQQDWIRNECLANDDKYTKTDYTKEFVLFEAEDDEIEIIMLEGLSLNHVSLYQIFIRDLDTKKVRFPFNTGDSELKDSLSPETYTDYKFTKLNKISSLNGETIKPCKEFKEKYAYNLTKMQRWGTASRSCLVAIPDSAMLPKTDSCQSQKRKSDDSLWVPLKELEQGEKAQDKRFFEAMKFEKENHVIIDSGKCKLYSLKTGVTYVGNCSQKVHGKNLLEANSTFAMSRSQAIASATKNRDAIDETFVIQKELLTITSKINLGGSARDGFQVRDLSDMDLTKENYLPGHAIPYSAKSFCLADNSPDSDLSFWQHNFAYPCGRAKARLFLEFGLMQTSVNAQNYLVAFNKPERGLGSGFRSKIEITRFILRDIGDSFWHNKYVEAILGEESGCYPQFKDEENDNKLGHTLVYSSSEIFPAPLMLRFGSAVVINGHGFGRCLEKRRGWSKSHVLELGQTIIDGFVSYVREVGLLDQILENNGSGFKSKKTKEHSIEDILNTGRLFQYAGSGTDYTNTNVEEYSKNEDWASLEAFQTVRKVIHLNKHKIKTDDDIVKALTAEEVCICFALENSLFGSTKKHAMLKRYLDKKVRLPDVVNYPKD
ncbi:hypothetical protein [Vibrio spartinae]|uniref:Uncharacterized protein n=1 Tax=Vibrio spartinae TaxID=1918945 RepID=A0A1N6M7I3_9VIBR|nr:hypothetical protein [Vibrio spartinae]QMV14124.1 hypothetical protein Vspart_01373 [Vibrio spartinae]SIO95389.1 hypothetical protein VSP9026_03132 [Vibrio spartinae]